MSIAKVWVNICRHHAFPAIFPFFIFGPRPDKHRTSLPLPSEPAGEARREAWRYFGGFWVRLTYIGAGRAVLGLLTTFLIMDRGDARAFRQYSWVYYTSAGGQILQQDDSSTFCAIQTDRPSQSGG